jgi:hypothetical protein
MPVMMEKLYDALRAAKVPEAQARAAAVEAAEHETRLGAIEGKLTLLAWMVGTLAAVNVAIGLPALWLLLRVATKVGVGF